MRKIALMLLMLAPLIASPCYSEDVNLSIPQRGVLSSANGRFVYGQISNLRRDQYMLDTQTGRLWQIVKEKGSENTVSKLLKGFTVRSLSRYTVLGSESPRRQGLSGMI